MQDKLPPLPAMSSGLSCLQLAQPVVHVGHRRCLLFSMLVMLPATWDPARWMDACMHFTEPCCRCAAT